MDTARHSRYQENSHHRATETLRKQSQQQNGSTEVAEGTEAGGGRGRGGPGVPVASVRDNRRGRTNAASKLEILRPFHLGRGYSRSGRFSLTEATRTLGAPGPRASVASATSVCSGVAFDFVFSVSPWLCGEKSLGCLSHRKMPNRLEKSSVQVRNFGTWRSNLALS